MGLYSFIRVQPYFRQDELQLFEQTCFIKGSIYKWHCAKRGEGVWPFWHKHITEGEGGRKNLNLRDVINEWSLVCVSVLLLPLNVFTIGTKIVVKLLLKVLQGIIVIILSLLLRSPLRNLHKTLNTLSLRRQLMISNLLIR